MADVKFDEKLAEFRKSIMANKSAWQSVMEANDQKYQKQLKEKNDRFSEIKTAFGQKEMDLTAEIQKKEKILDIVSTEVKSLSAEIESLNQKVLEEERARKEEVKIREEEIRAIEKEIEQVGVDARKRSRTREEEWEMVDSKEKRLIDQMRVLQSRLREEQNHWEEVLKIKEQDFTALKTELEQRIKEWRAEYQKKESEVQLFKKAGDGLDDRLAQLDEALGAQEIKWREQIMIKQDEINTYKRDLAAMETAHTEEISEKEEAIESLKLEMEKFLGELSGTAESEA
ncbi:MAG: hypothetical protein JW983_00200 [Elusimicrobia bacterium]|nr:hypothetical protein [Elusimicrobiota bacterium]